MEDITIDFKNSCTNKTLPAWVFKLIKKDLWIQDGHLTTYHKHIANTPRSFVEEFWMFFSQIS